MTGINANDQLIKSSLCRLCGNANQNGTNIFSEETEQNLSQLINKYLPLKVENDGKYPDKICPGCEIQLEATKLFFDLIIEGQNQLKSIFDDYKNTQILQVQDIQNISGTLEVQSVETGEKYFIQIVEDTPPDGPLYSADHEMLANMDILKRQKKKRGRPRKQLMQKEEKKDIESSTNEEGNSKNDNSNNEYVEDGKRQRKVPARFSETVQGKELDDILRKEGIEEEELDSEIPVKLDTEIIGTVEDQNGEKLEEAVIVTRVQNGNRVKRNVIQRRKRKRKYKCDKCSEEFRNYPRLKMHIDQMHVVDESKEVSDQTDNVADSENCLKKSENEENSSPNLLDASLRPEYEATNPEEHSSDNKKTSGCDRCTEIFNSEAELNIHMENSHRNGNRFKCPECNRYFSYPKTFEMHLKRHKEGIFSCEICQKKFNHSSSLIYHRNVEHNNGKRFVCSKCNKIFKHRQLLHRHQLVHTEERPYKCNLCSSAFKTKTNLISHTNTHTGEKNYLCLRCGQSFAHKTSLNLHLRWHRGEKPFSCEICKKKFSQKGNLMEHTRIHTGEKPFFCNICGRNFTTSSQLKLHTKRHTGERPWKCEFCPKTFLHKDSWKEHSRRHMNERPFKCELCNKAFTAMYCLKKHMRFHTGEKPHTCDVCLKGFSDLSNLTKHKKIHEQKSKDDQNQDMTLLNAESDNLLYVYYGTTKDQNIEVPIGDLEQAQTEVVIGSDENVLDFKGECMHIQQLIDQEGNPLRLNTQDGQQINVVTSITNGQEKLQGLLPDGTLVALDLQDSKVDNMKSLVDHVEEETSVTHLLLDGNMTFLNDHIDKPGGDLLVSEQSDLCFVTYDPNTENI